MLQRFPSSPVFQADVLPDFLCWYHRQVARNTRSDTISSVTIMVVPFFFPKNLSIITSSGNSQIYLSVTSHKLHHVSKHPKHDISRCSGLFILFCRSIICQFQAGDILHIERIELVSCIFSLLKSYIAWKILDIYVCRVICEYFFA